ncbi:hypothetical protein BDW22DRAFT_884645 [Trametopsis cervina]|nr:hypothetical protein BDW22DRAFT_884645 [Trametopsis cervina]
MSDSARDTTSNKPAWRIHQQNCSGLKCPYSTVYTGKDLTELDRLRRIGWRGLNRMRCHHDHCLPCTFCLSPSHSHTLTFSSSLADLLLVSPALPLPSLPTAHPLPCSCSRLLSMSLATSSLALLPPSSLSSCILSHPLASSRILSHPLASSRTLCCHLLPLSLTLNSRILLHPLAPCTVPCRLCRSR